MTSKTKELPPCRPGVVDRCVCVGMLFSTWLEMKQKNGWTMMEAERMTGCGFGCRSCQSYLAMAANTGQTEFPLQKIR